MSNSATELTKFLISPRIQRYESLRGYVARVAQRNDAMCFVQKWLESNSSATRSIASFAKLTGTDSETLLSRGSEVRPSDLSKPKIRIGNTLMPAHYLWPAGRRFCPQCLADNGISQGYWEFKLYSVCHIHGVRMLFKCTDCYRRVNWKSESPDACRCGLPLSSMTSDSEVAYKDQVICSLLAVSFRRTINAGRAISLIRNNDRYLMLDWTIFLFDFIRSSFLSSFSGTDEGTRFQITDLAKNQVAVEILRDSNLREPLLAAVSEICSRNSKIQTNAGDLSEINVATADKFLHRILGSIGFRESLWKILMRKPSQKDLRIKGVAWNAYKTTQPQLKGVFLIPKREDYHAEYY